MYVHDAQPHSKDGKPLPNAMYLERLGCLEDTHTEWEWRYLPIVADGIMTSPRNAYLHDMRMFPVEDKAQCGISVSAYSNQGANDTRYIQVHKYSTQLCT